MPLTPAQKLKLDPSFLVQLEAMGALIIGAKVPPSLAYALRDEIRFEDWPNDAIEAVARLAVGARKIFAPAPAADAEPDAEPTPAERPTAKSGRGAPPRGSAAAAKGKPAASEQTGVNKARSEEVKPDSVIAPGASS